VFDICWTRDGRVAGVLVTCVLNVFDVLSGATDFTVIH
jgi:hypothetical protein